MKNLIVFALFVSTQIAFAQIQPNNSRCLDIYDEAVRLLDTDRSSGYYERGVVQVALRLKERADELSDEARYLKKISDKNDRDGTWRFLNINESLNDRMIDRGLSDPIHDSYNFIEWTKGSIQDRANEGSSKEDLLALLREIESNARGARPERMLQARDALKNEIARTQEVINRGVSPVLIELDRRAGRMEGLTRGILNISYDLVGSSYYSSWRLDPSSKLGRLRSNLDDLRPCLSY